MLRKTLFALSLPLAAAACSTFEDIDDGLGVMRGQPVDRLIGVLGFPDGEQNIAGRRFVTWSTSQTITTVNQMGGFGGVPASFVPVTSNYNCTIKVEVDAANRIVGHDFDGNIGGCQQYARAIRSALSA